MISYANRVFRKVRKVGVTETLKVAGRCLHHRIYRTDWDFELVPSVLEQILREKRQVVIIEIGANVGNTSSDQLYNFLKKHCLEAKSPGPPRCRALLVEPVKHLFDQLVANYEGFNGVQCENVAIAEVSGTRDFYRLCEGIDPALHGLPPEADQLGSFLPEQMASLLACNPGSETLREFVRDNVVVDKVRCSTINELLVKHGLTEVDLLQIDTEGYDYQIVRTIDFEKVSPRFINYERIHLKKDEARCRNMLLDRGYSLHDHGQDTFCSLTSRQTSLRLWRERAYNMWLNCIH